jgi:hypothetical protein
MRLLRLIFLIVAAGTSGCDRSKPSQPVESAGDQKIVKDYFADGSLKSVTRLHRDGSLLGTLHYSNGVPTHADYFDEQKRVRRTLIYRADGTASVAREFDEHGDLIAEQQLDAPGQPAETKRQ